MILASAFVDLLPAILLLISFAVVGGMIILILRKKMKSNSSSSSTFTLSELRKLRDDGTINEKEYDRAKQSIIDHSK